MAKGRTLKINIVGDSKDALRAFKRTQNGVAAMAKKAKASFAAVAKATAVAGAAFAGVAAGAHHLASSADDLFQAQSKANQVFGEADKVVAKYADSAAQLSGLSKQAATDAASAFGILLKQTDKSSTEVANMSVSLTKLSGDLASFHNISSGDAAQKLFSGLSGESEPLKSLGIFINEAAVQAKALELGLGDASGALTDQEKILARYHLILGATADAQGDYALTADSLANVQRTLGAQFENLKAELGEGLAPIFAELLGTVSEAMPQILDWLGPKMSASIEGTKTVFGTFGPIVQDAFGSALEWAQSVWPQVEEQVSSVMESIGGVLQSFADLAISLWDFIGEDIMRIVGNLAKGLLPVFSHLFDGVKAIFDAFAALFRGDWEALGQAILDLWDASVGVLKEAINTLIPAVIDLFTSLGSSLLEVIGSALGGIVEFFGGLGGQILDALGDFGSLLWDAGASIIDGLIGGIESGINALASTLQGVTNLIPSWKGPAEVDRRLLYGNGRLIMQGLNEGLWDGFDRIVAPGLGEMTANIGGGFGAGMTQTTNNSAQHTVINMNLSNPDPEAVARAVRNIQRTGTVSAVMV